MVVLVNRVGPHSRIDSHIYIYLYIYIYIHTCLANWRDNISLSYLIIMFEHLYSRFCWTLMPPSCTHADPTMPPACRRPPWWICFIITECECGEQPDACWASLSQMSCQSRCLRLGNAVRKRWIALCLDIFLWKAVQDSGWTKMTWQWQWQWRWWKFQEI